MLKNSLQFINFLGITHYSTHCLHSQFCVYNTLRVASLLLLTELFYYFNCS